MIRASFPDSTPILTACNEGGFVALDPVTGSASQGETEGEALANLCEAVELYLEEFPHPVR